LRYDNQGNARRLFTMGPAIPVARSISSHAERQPLADIATG